MEIDHNKLKGFLSNHQYQVFILSSHIPWPFSLWRHFWFVIKKGSELERWEFGKFRRSPHKNNIGVVKDLLPFTEGMNKYIYSTSPRAKSYLHHYIEGNSGSLAERMVNFIGQRADEYPLGHRYRYLGPNSNTFIQWVLNHFPDLDYKLPWRAMGKGYKQK